MGIIDNIRDRIGLSRPTPTPSQPTTKPDETRLAPPKPVGPIVITPDTRLTPERGNTDYNQGGSKAPVSAPPINEYTPSSGRPNSPSFGGSSPNPVSPSVPSATPSNVGLNPPANPSLNNNVILPITLQNSRSSNPMALMQTEANPTALLVQQGFGRVGQESEISRRTRELNERQAESDFQKRVDVAVDSLNNRKAGAVLVQKAIVDPFEVIASPVGTIGDRTKEDVKRELVRERVEEQLRREEQDVTTFEGLRDDILSSELVQIPAFYGGGRLIAGLRGSGFIVNSASRGLAFDSVGAIAGGVVVGSVGTDITKDVINQDYDDALETVLQGGVDLASGVKGFKSARPKVSVSVTESDIFVPATEGKGKITIRGKAKLGNEEFEVGGKGQFDVPEVDVEGPTDYALLTRTAKINPKTGQVLNVVDSNAVGRTNIEDLPTLSKNVDEALNPKLARTQQANFEAVEDISFASDISTGQSKIIMKPTRFEVTDASKNVDIIIPQAQTTYEVAQADLFLGRQIDYTEEAIFSQLGKGQTLSGLDTANVGRIRVRRGVSNRIVEPDINKITNMNDELLDTPITKDNAKQLREGIIKQQEEAKKLSEGLVLENQVDEPVKKILGKEYSTSQSGFLPEEETKQFLQFDEVLAKNEKDLAERLGFKVNDENLVIDTPEAGQGTVLRYDLEGKTLREGKGVFTQLADQLPDRRIGLDKVAQNVKVIQDNFIKNTEQDILKMSNLPKTRLGGSGSSASISGIETAQSNANIQIPVSRQSQEQIFDLSTIRIPDQESISITNQFQDTVTIQTPRLDTINFQETTPILIPDVVTRQDQILIPDLTPVFDTPTFPKVGIPTFTPPPYIPPIVPIPSGKFPSGDIFGKRFNTRSRRSRNDYNPSLLAIQFNIKGKRPKNLTGLEIRPLDFDSVNPFKKSKKRKAKR